MKKNNKLNTFGNPMLLSAINLYLKEKSPYAMKMFADEMLHSAFLVPMSITPPPRLDENGKIVKDPNAKVNMPTVLGPNEKRFFVAYTDLKEMKNQKIEPGMKVNILGFRDYVSLMIESKQNCEGFIINPYGVGVVITPEVVSAIIGLTSKPKAESAAEVNAEAEETSET